LRIDTGKGWLAAEVQVKLMEMGNYVLKNTSGTMPGILVEGQAAEREITGEPAMEQPPAEQPESPPAEAPPEAPPPEQPPETQQ
jgi:hypothetical protein